MTLIIGSTHWNGICFNVDTRATNLRTRTYTDNAQKMSHVHGGIGMVACGDRDSAIMVRETIRKHLDEFALTGQSFGPEVDLQDVYYDLFKESLKKLREHPFNNQRPIYDVSSSGLIGVNITDQPLRLNKEECENIVRILVEGGRINEIYSRNISNISQCASGALEYAEINEFSQNTLYRYKVKLFDDESADIYEVERVPFGKIIALGSGSNFNYDAVQSKVLSYMLFSEHGDDSEVASFHLGMIHYHAEQEVPVDSRFNFRTFGGAIVPGVIVTDDHGMGYTKILLGDNRSQLTGELISSVKEKSDGLWVITKDGNEVKLEEFPDQIGSGDSLLWTE